MIADQHGGPTLRRAAKDISVQGVADHADTAKILLASVLLANQFKDRRERFAMEFDRTAN